MKLEKLTPSQEKIMHDVKQHWLDYIFSCKNSVNREKAKISIDWLYKFCGLNSPIVIFVDSPMACQYAVIYAKAYGELLKKAQVRAQVRDEVGDQVQSPLVIEHVQVGSDRILGAAWHDFLPG